MKVGSLVVIVNHVVKNQFVKWMPVMDEQTIYTIRKISTDRLGAAVLLEEGIIGYVFSGEEIHIDIEFVKEIQPPQDVQAFVKMIQEESICQPV